MKSFNPRKNPEAKLQKEIKKFLEYKGWYVKNVHGSKYQSGLPDLFACHHLYGQRWIEIKLPDFKGSKFTPAQLETFPKLCQNGSDVWILTRKSEYKLLFKKGNWWTYTDIWRK